MTWGAFFMYYQCPKCGKKFKSSIDVMNELGADFGKCPICNADGTFIKEGPNDVDSNDYEEVD